MEYTLETYGGVYTPKWLIEDKNLTKQKPQKSGKRQWYVAGFPVGSIEQNKSIEKYAITKILEALNSEDSFGAMITLKKKWYKGGVRLCMDKEIKEGTYSLERCIEYTSKKGFTGFYDKHDPTFEIRIPAEKIESIVELSSLGASPKTIYNAMDLECSLVELEMFIQLNQEGMLDKALNHIASHSRTAEGYIDYVRDGVKPIKDKHLNDFKIKNEG